MRIASTLFILLFAHCAIGQSKLKFHSQNYFGIMAGKSDAAIQFQTINGFQKRTWFGGVGTGLDYYFQGSVPLYLSVSKFLTLQRNSFFLSLDGGTHFIVDKSTANVYNGFTNDGDFSPLLNYGAHAGYKMGLKNGSSAVLMSLGYVTKRIKEKYTAVAPCFFPPCEEYKEITEYDLNRISFRIGWMF